jgi:hypothetical protein
VGRSRHDQFSSVNRETVSIRKTIHTERNYDTSSDRSCYTRSSAISRGPNHVHDAHQVPASRRKLDVDVTRTTSLKRPTPRTEQGSASANHNALLQCRQRLILHEIRKLGRQRGSKERISRRAATGEEPLIRPTCAKGALQRKSLIRTSSKENAKTHLGEENFFSRMPSSSVLEEIPFDQLHDEFDAGSREDLVNQANVSINVGKAYLNSAERRHRSRAVAGSYSSKASHSTIGARNDGMKEWGKCDVEAQTRTMADEPPRSARILSTVDSPPHITRVHMGRGKSERKQDFNMLHDAPSLVLQHRSRVTSQIRSMDATSEPHDEDDNDSSSSGSTNKVSNVVASTPHQRDVSFDERHSFQNALADQDPAKEGTSRSVEGANSTGGNPQSVGVGKRYSFWNKFSKGNDRIPLFCGSRHSKANTKLSTTAITAYSSSSDRSTTSFGDNFPPKRKQNGVASVTASTNGESAKSNSSKHHLGKLMCALHNKERSNDWYVSKKPENTTSKDRGSVMEMVFYDLEGR